MLYVFAGLVPFLGTIEAINGAALSIKANMHLVKNVMLPIELVPVRTVLVAMTGELRGLGARDRAVRVQRDRSGRWSWRCRSR